MHKHTVHARTNTNKPRECNHLINQAVETRKTVKTARFMLAAQLLEHIFIIHYATVKW